MSKYGETVVVKQYVRLGDEVAVALLCDETNQKWWRLRAYGNTIDVGIKTFSNIEKIRYEDGEYFEVIDGS